MKHRLPLMALLLGAYLLYLASLICLLRAPFLPWLLLVVVPLFLYEAGLRLFLRNKYGAHWREALFSYFIVDHPDYGYAFRKNSSARAVPFPLHDKFVLRPGTHSRVDFNINSLGFRGPEFAPRKKDGVTRIFASGDSATVCAFNDDAETWPAQLEKELKKQGINAEVINAGMGAWPLYQQRLRFEREIVNYEPDIVLLHAGWNEEFMYSCQNLGRGWRPNEVMNAVEIKTLYARVGRFFSSTVSIFFHFLVAAYFYDYRFKRSMDFSKPARWRCLKAPEYLENWFDNLVVVARIAAARGIKLYTINPPGMPALAGTADYADYQATGKRRVSKALADAERLVPMIDAERGQSRAELFYDKIHLNPRGNAELAKIVAGQLIAAGAFSGQGSNITYDEAAVAAIRAKVGINEPAVEAFIDRRLRSFYNPHT